MQDNSETQGSTRNRVIANILLILTTLLWGTSFIITKNLTQEVPAFLYLGIRFSIAAIGFIPYFIRIKIMNKKILLFGTFIFQNWSQQHQGPTQMAIIFTLEPVFIV